MVESVYWPVGLKEKEIVLNNASQQTNTSPIATVAIYDIIGLQKRISSIARLCDLQKESLEHCTHLFQ